MAAAHHVRRRIAVDHAQHVMLRRMHGLSDHFRDVFDAAKRPLQGDYSPQIWLADLTSLSVNALELFRCTPLDYGLIFDCDRFTECVGPRYVEIPKEGLFGARRPMVDVTLESGHPARKVNVRAMVRQEEAGLLGVTFVKLASVDLPPGRYRGTIEYGQKQFPCSMIRR